MKRKKAMRSVIILLFFASITEAAQTSLIDYFLPIPIESSLVSNVWGDVNVFPRDPKNGLEDETMKQWCYWDGQIIKSKDGTIDVPKEAEKGNDAHGSKIIVVPFDGVSFDRDMQRLSASADSSSQ